MDFNVGCKMKKGIYRHYKGNEYELIDVAVHSETMEEMVVYRALYGEQRLWVRPAYMWNEEIVLEDGRRVLRFEFIGKVKTIT